MTEAARPAGATSPPAVGGASADANTSSSSSTTELQGRYVDTLGSVIIMQRQQQAGGAEPGARAAFRFLAHTDKQLQFGDAAAE